MSTPHRSFLSRLTRSSGRRWLLGLVACLGPLAVCSLASGQYLRMVAYNVEADIGGVTTPREGLFTVLEAIGQQSYAGIRQPVDILALEEATSNLETVTPIVTALNGYYGAGIYAFASYQGTQRGNPTGGNGPNAIIYNTRTVSLVLQNGAEGVGVPGTPSTSGGASRQVIRYEFQPVNTPAASLFYVYVSHMKSSYDGLASDLTARNAEAQLITADIARLPAGSSVLAMGDFNMGGSTEDAYQTLTTNGPFVDPLNVPQNNQQTWNVALYKSIMTDSTTGLRYRDDIQFMTTDIYGSTSAIGLHYLPGSCRAFGNNGTTSIGGSTDTAKNTSLQTNFQGSITASSALTALTTGSDHLPIVADYFVSTPYTNWQVNHFTPAELSSPAISADGADPDGDGVTNLLEYAFNLDPHVTGVRGLPAVSQTAVGGKQYLTLTYTKVIAATDVTYVPQISGDLATWSSGPAHTVQVSVANNSDGATQTIVVRDLTPMSGTNARFARVLITRP